ncbi:hypothetical protein EYZ11_000992 [Aspergillus tanneri]|uniref:Transcription factor domain-containing protein n=1 Tax=Aspergillus tanneri TaxID=1220188 RepID=A0A4S3JVQ9_9EURO|nr:hypothetical protein EYZ11_000992 [Aspergillus tanneri]
MRDLCESEDPMSAKSRFSDLRPLSSIEQTMLLPTCSVTLQSREKGDTPFPRPRRIEALEGKVNQLLGQIKSESPQEESSSINPAVGTTRKGSTTKRTPSEKPPAPDVIAKGIISFDDACSLFDQFRRSMMPHFPFVIIPEETTLQELREQKPFLLLAILTVSLYENMPLRRVLLEEFRNAVRECMVFGLAESPFEVLQGLLVSLGW